MKRLVGVSLAIASILAVSSISEAHGFKKSSCGSGGFSGDCGSYSGCATSVCYVDQVVSGTRPETKTRQVEKTVYKQVTNWIDESFDYQECVTEWVNQTTKVTTNVWVADQVPYTYYVSVPVVTPVTRTVTTYKCVADTVTSNVCVTRKIAVQEIDPCTGCCRTVCKCITEMQPVCKTIMRTVPVTSEITCNQTTYTSVLKNGVKTVYKCVPKTEDVTFKVAKTVLVPKKGTRKKLICETVPVKVMVTECYTVMVPCTYTVKVAVPCATPVVTCAPVVSDCGFEAMACSTSCGHSKSSKLFGFCKK